jgi:putative PEP-CTERM system histidine kinase
MADAFSFTLGAIAHLLVTVLARTRWLEVTRRSGLVLALGVQALWSGTYALDAIEAAPPQFFIVAVEILRTVCWMAVLVRALFPVLDAAFQPALLRTLYVMGFLLPAVAICSQWLIADDQLSGWLLDFQRWCGLLLSLFGLILVEQFARNTRQDLRWHLRYVWLGIGILLATDLAVWSISLLSNDIGGFRSDVRATVNAAVAVLVLIALRRLPVPLNTGLLRRSGALFFNGTLVMAGVYVLLMSAASLALRQGVEDARSYVQALFVGASLVLFSVAVFSAQFRAWSRVMWSKYLRPYRYDYREVWLALTRSLSETSEVPVRRRAALTLASFVNSGGGQIWERDGDVYRPAEPDVDGAAPVSVPHGAFFEFLGRRDWIYEVRESSAPTHTASLGESGAPPLPPASLLGCRPCWLIVPLSCNDELVGFAVIDRPFVETSLGWEQLDLLRAAGRQIGSFLALSAAATRLAEMHQFEAFNRLSGFVMHDLRHLVAQLALVVDNAARHRRNPAFIDDAILTIESSVKRMTALMALLKGGVVSEPDRRLEVTELLQDVVERCRLRDPSPILETDGVAIEVTANRERLGQAIEHLVRNAQDATPASGSVRVSVRRGAQLCEIEIADTGCGMTDEFIRSRLFRPFDSTKSQDGLGLGACEARDIIRKAGGTVHVTSSVGKGTIFKLSLPLAPPALP